MAERKQPVEQADKEHTRPRNLIPSVREDYSQPFITQQAKLYSLHAQQVFSRGFDSCSRSLYTLSYVLRLIGTDDQASEVAALIEKEFTAVSTDLVNEITRTQMLLDNNGIDATVNYTAPQVVEAKISAPFAFKYLALIQSYDQFIGKLDALWFSAQIDDKHYAARIYEWKRRLQRLAGRVRQITSRAVIAARRAEEKEQQAEDAEMTKAESEAAGTAESVIAVAKANDREPAAAAA
jgi:hypothetical protein